jgi:hypothetical protein
MDPKVIRSLPKEFQDSPLDFLVNERLTSTPSSDPEIGSEFIELHNELDGLRKEMQKLVPASLLAQYEDSMAGLNYLENTNLYRNGLRDGFWLALELFAKEPEKLENQNRAEKGEEKRMEHVTPARKVKAL